DDSLRQLVSQHGVGAWARIGAAFGTSRNGRQCRERWRNQLDPAINKEPWSRQEELCLLDAHQELGNKWTEISNRLPGRTDNGRFHIYYMYTLYVRCFYYMYILCTICTLYSILCIYMHWHMLCWQR
ncbi:Homeodomain-like protein, partial [Ochromonadaceae sp. CCMP2298]